MAAVAMGSAGTQDRAEYRLIDAQEAAVLLGVDPRTIRRYSAAGKLMACVSSSRRRAYRIDDVCKLHALSDNMCHS